LFPSFVSYVITVNLLFVLSLCHYIPVPSLVCALTIVSWIVCPSLCYLCCRFAPATVHAFILVVSLGTFPLFCAGSLPSCAESPAVVDVAVRPTHGASLLVCVWCVWVCVCDVASAARVVVRSLRLLCRRDAAHPLLIALTRTAITTHRATRDSPRPLLYSTPASATTNCEQDGRITKIYPFIRFDLTLFCSLN